MIWLKERQQRCRDLSRSQMIWFKDSGSRINGIRPPAVKEVACACDDPSGQERMLSVTQVLPRETSQEVAEFMVAFSINKEPKRTTPEDSAGAETCVLEERHCGIRQKLLQGSTAPAAKNPVVDIGQGPSPLMPHYYGLSLIHI